MTPTALITMTRQGHAEGQKQPPGAAKLDLTVFEAKSTLWKGSTLKFSGIFRAARAYPGASPLHLDPDPKGG